MLQTGDTFERYRVDEVLGSGGMGCVYRAHDSRLERRVALKVISEGAASAEANARLLREARAAAALDHPNAVSIFDVGEVDGAPYIVMELVSGRTLREAISKDPAPLGTRLVWLSDIARALGAAHKKGLVHRDIKPENVMVRDDGVVKVLDFGIARRYGGEVDAIGPTAQPALPTLTRDGVKLGTPLYMAPEQIKGDTLDGRADQFAWGVLAHELLTGQVPWRGTDALAAVASILTDDPNGALLEQAGVPQAAREAILRALSKRPADRFASMDDLLQALHPDANDSPAHASSPSPPATTAEKAPAPANAGTTASSKYSTQEVHDILARAVDRQAQKPDNRLAFDDLLEAAREVGVEENVLREASREIRKRAEPASVATGAQDDEFAAWQRRRKRKFARHLGVYLIVNVAFAILAIAEGRPQMLAPALFWGIGLGIHFLNTLFASREDFADEQKRQARKDELKQQWVDRHMRRRQRRGETLERVIDEGASLLLATGTKIRQRIEGVKAKASAPHDSRTPARTDQPSPSADAPKDKAGQARLRVESGTEPLRDAGDEQRVSAEAEAEARALVDEAEAEARALVDQSRSGQPKG